MIHPVLVVEDDRKIARVVALYLEEAGYRVVQADSGRKALDEAAKEVPLLDRPVRHRCGMVKNGYNMDTARRPVTGLEVARLEAAGVRPEPVGTRPWHPGEGAPERAYEASGPMASVRRWLFRRPVRCSSPARAKKVACSRP